jgi:hypothetical protein
MRHVCEGVAECGAVVAALWRLQIVNRLTMATRRGAGALITIFSTRA